MEEFLKEYLALLKLERNLSENTVLSYESDLKSFIRFLDESDINDFDDVTHTSISVFLKTKEVPE